MMNPFGDADGTIGLAALAVGFRNFINRRIEYLRRRLFLTVSNIGVEKILVESASSSVTVRR
jgi:hypothetical protein